MSSLHPAPVVQTLDSAIHRINNYPAGPGCSNFGYAIHRLNHYPVDKYYGNKLRHPQDSDLSGGCLNNRTLINNREINRVIQWIEIYPADMGPDLHISFVGRRAFFSPLFSKKVHDRGLRKMVLPKLLILFDPAVVKI